MPLSKGAYNGDCIYYNLLRVEGLALGPSSGNLIDEVMHHNIADVGFEPTQVENIHNGKKIK